MRCSFSNTVRQCIYDSLYVGVLSTLTLCSITLLFSHSLSAGDFQTENAELTVVSSPDSVSNGSLLFKSDKELLSAPLLSTGVEITVTGMIARAKVRQSFLNTTGNWQEGVYVFPLPESAAVDRLRMHIGERVIEGQIKEKQKAKRQYKAARKAGKKATLVEQERPNIFTSSVANIAPGETIVVEIEYQEIVRFDTGSFSLRFHTVVAPRYIPGTQSVEGFSGDGWAINTDKVRDASRITPHVLHPRHGKINPLSIVIQIDTGFELALINSPYHAINKKHFPGSSKYEISLQEKSIPADRDFVLEWKAAESSTPRAAFFRERLGDADYALLMLMPPARGKSQILSRELIFVIDTSGSMAGTSIAQAKSALQLALSRLKPGDRFNIIQFNTYTSTLFSSSLPFSKQTLHQATEYIHSLRANGGTEMAPAIRAALKDQSSENDIRQVVFLTDGSVGNEAELFQKIERQLGQSRLFTIGIGSAPNSHFMNRAAKFGRGSHTYIGSIHEVQEKMKTLFSKLESPVLSDLKIHLPQQEKLEIWPQKIPDLYLGEPLLVSIRGESLPQSLNVSGKIAGNDWSSQLSLKGGQKRSGLSQLWARRKIAALMDLGVRGEDAKHIRQQVISTALEHHLVSKYTSLIAVDVTPSRPENSSLNKRPVPVNLPAGMQHNKIFGTMPRTATPASLYFLAGALLMLLSLSLRRIGFHV